MRVTLTETGGWTNIRRSCTVDTLDLPAETARALEAAVDQVEPNREYSEPPLARDTRRLLLEVDKDGTRTRTSFSDAAVPPEAIAVLEILSPLCVIVPAR